jgi:hypothetical protein
LWRFQQPYRQPIHAQYDYAANTDGHFLTIVRETGTIGYREITSAKVTGFTLSGEVGMPMRISFQIIGSDAIWDSPVNDSTSFANVTFPETENRILWGHLGALASTYGIWINDQSGGALAQGDVIYPASFELTFTRTLKGRYGQGSNYDIIDEPTNDANPTCTLSLQMPRLTGTTYFTDWAAGTAKKLQIYTRGALMNGTDYRESKLEFPHLEYQNVESPEVAGQMGNPLTFNVLAADAAPTGMTITNPLRWTLKNDYGGDPLQVGN